MGKEEHTTIAITPEVRDELKNLGKKGETYDQILRRLTERVQKLEEVLAFSGVASDADAKMRDILETRKHHEESETLRLKEKERKEKLIADVLANPPQCEVCDAVMTPLQPIPRFSVGDWSIKSADPMTWDVQFECPKSTKLDQHGRVTIYPDLEAQRAPRKHRKSLGDNIPIPHSE